MARNKLTIYARAGIALTTYARADIAAAGTDDTTATKTFAEDPVTPEQDAETPTPEEIEGADDQDMALWTGVLGMENTMTGDGRLIEKDALRWETPLPIRYVASDVGGHDGAQVVGSIQHIERDEDTGQIHGTGIFDMNSEAGREAMRQVQEGLTTGVSMDLDDVSFEVQVAEEVIRKMHPHVEETDPASDEDDSETDKTAAIDPEELEVNEDGRVVMLKSESNQEVHVTTSARIRAATIVAIPAFAEATIEIVEQGDTMDDEEAIEAIDTDAAEEELAEQGFDDTEEFNWVEKVGGLPSYIRRIAKHMMAKGMTESHAIAAAVNTVKRWARGGKTAKHGGKTHVSAKTAAKAAAAVAEWEAKKIRAKAHSASTEAMTASASPARPPIGWFADPKLTEPTPITVTEDGRVFGHLATWDSCHIAHPDYCTSPPSSATDYAYFHTGAVLADDGKEVAVGHLTLNTTHANGNAGPVATLAHYENTGLVAADVRAGEDEHGIWVAGSVRPNLSDDDVRALRSAPLSGDWRRVQGNLELVAALAVNVPGFPVPRPKGLVASGEMQSLVASGMIPPKRVRRPGTPGALSASDLRYLKSLANRERRNRAEALAQRLKTAQVQGMAAKLATVSSH